MISSDGAYALSASWDKSLRLWELATCETTRTFVGHTNDVLSVSFDKYESGADIRVHIGVPVTGVDYKPQKHYPSHLHADVQREDLTIRVIHVILDEAAA